MEDKLKKLHTELKDSLKRVKNNEQLENIRIKFFGRKDGQLTNVLKGLKDLSIDAKKNVGSLANQIKTEAQAEISKIKKNLKKDQPQEKSEFDITANLEKTKTGHLHPVTQMTEQIWDVFRSLNFEIMETPDIESDDNNFKFLNFPENHPARDMQDSFYLSQEKLLKSHTTTFQPRIFKDQKPPIKAINTGKCYRRDSDITHTPMFHQFDGICVDKGVSMSNLKYTLEAVMRQVLDDDDLKVRFRTSYFPFVEPGAEFDVTCTICGGKGCQTCKKTGWLEMGGCGMIHPNILKNFDIDTDVYSGWAFGFGIERVYMIKHKIADLRLFYQNDLRFLRQF